MTCFNEIQGIRTIALYVNDGVRFRFPDPSKENEIDLIAHAVGSIVINDEIEQPKWSRELNYSGNYKQNYSDTFTFLVHGMQNEVPAILQEMRNNRKGYIVEVITTGGQSYVFPSPVFVVAENTKKINSHSWNVELRYRVPTHRDKYTKLNTMLMTNSYISVGNNAILGTGAYIPIVSN